MPKLSFFFLNVFAEKAFTGNQLAVFASEQELSPEVMQQIAREVNFAETSFVTIADPAAKAYRARTFTPRGEVPFAGHPALGTAYVIQRFYQQGKMKPVHLTLPGGDVPITQREEGMMWLEQSETSFGEVLPIEALSPVLGLAPAVFDTRLPIEIVSTGLPFVIVPLRHLDAVKQASVSLIRYNQLISEIPAKAFFIFSSQTYQPENDYNGRVFGHYYGVPEDTASGSANACLAAYLLKHQQPQLDARVEQGYEVERPSLLRIQGKKEGETYQVRVGGKVRLLARGEWEEGF
jgi:trans-2,3-dihydro-3-hydroxyanthranilate isomerase